MKKIFYGISIVLIFILVIMPVSGCASQDNPDVQLPERGNYNPATMENVAEHIYSHRGTCEGEIEHTFAAYDLAIFYGSGYIEQDVVVSKDGTLYVSHDPSALRITGEDKLYSEMKDREIDKLETKDGQNILKLSDVFDRYGDNQEVCFLVEVKDVTAKDTLISMIKNYNFESRVIVQSVDLPILQSVKEALPEVRTLYVHQYQEEFETALALEYVDILGAKKTIMTQENCDAAHANGKIFSVWTLNSTEEIVTAIRLGVDTYFTDYTAKAFALEQTYRNIETE